jgi:methanogenic corrinoid protein MtbC1
MMVEGNGYEVIDLGVDVSADKFLMEAEKHPHAVIGLSALLTTTMVNMENIVKAIKEKNPDARGMHWRAHPLRGTSATR